MKTKTAFALSAAALIGAGVTLGIKSKQEKDSFEKILKTVLIPDAEKKLEDLLKENAALNDSIITYEQALEQINSKQDSITATRSSYRIDSDFNKIYNLMYDIYRQWSDPMNEALKKLGWEYNEEYDYAWRHPEIKGTKQEIETFSMIYHRTGDASGYFPHIKNYPEFNGIKTEFVLKDHILIPELKEIKYRGDDKPTQADVETIDTELTVTYKIDKFTRVIRDAIKSLSTHTRIEGYYDYGEDSGWVEVYTPANKHPGQRLAILKSLQSFLDVVDNSKKVFNPKTLNALQAEINKLLPTVEKEYALYNKEMKTSEKLNKFTEAQKAIQKSIPTQKAKIKHLKSTDVRKLLNEQKQK